MALLGSAAYDPSSAATIATDTLTAMTAIDTTNLRITFTVPASGNVLVRMAGPTIGAASVYPRVLFGVLEGATIKGRVQAGGVSSAAAAGYLMQHATFLVTGLTPAASLTWDAAMSVDVVVASTALKYGGPDDASGADAWGGFFFEVWEAPNLLSGKLYDPGTAVTKSAASLLAMTAIDTTNLRLTFNAPASGKVLWRIRGGLHGATTRATTLLGVMSGASILARSAPVYSIGKGGENTSVSPAEAMGIITGLTPGGAQTWDAAYAVQVVVSSSGYKYGGPDNTTTNDAFGGFIFEAWDPTTAQTTGPTFFTGMVPI